MNKEKLYEVFKKEFIDMIDEIPNINECELHTIEDETEEVYYDYAHYDDEPKLKTVKYAIGYYLNYEIENGYYSIEYYFDENMFRASVKNGTYRNSWYIEIEREEKDNEKEN